MLFFGVRFLPEDFEIRQLVERACVEFEEDLRAFLSGVLRDGHLVDDAFQRCVMHALENAASVRPETVRGWLFRIALNEARAIKRVVRQQGRLHQSVWHAQGAADRIDQADGLQSAVSAEQKAWIQQALNRLCDNHREVVVRRIQQGKTFAVIAQEIDRPLGTVLTWMRRALAELREMEELRQLQDGDSDTGSMAFDKSGE